MCVMYEDHEGKCSSSTRDRDLEWVSRSLKSSKSNVTVVIDSVSEEDVLKKVLWQSYRDGLNHALAVIEGVRTNATSS